MGLLDNGLLGNGLKGNVVTGLAIGIGASILAPLVVPLAAAIVKPLLKGTIKGGIILYEKGQEMVAEAGEVVEDLMAEAKAELAPAPAEIESAAPETAQPKHKGKT